MFVANPRNGAMSSKRGKRNPYFEGLYANLGWAMEWFEDVMLTGGVHRLDAMECWWCKKRSGA